MPVPSEDRRNGFSIAPCVNKLILRSRRNMQPAGKIGARERRNATDANDGDGDGDGEGDRPVDARGPSCHAQPRNVSPLDVTRMHVPVAH